MLATLQRIIEGALERLATTTITYLPPLLAAVTIFVGALVVAVLVRWTLTRLIKAAAIDRFLLQSGLSTMFSRSGSLRATPLLAGAAFWMILLVGVITALSAFNSLLTSRMIENMVFLLPKLVTAAAILLTGAWLGRYLGRGILVWACNEGFPHARSMAAAVRILVVFVSVVVAADHLDFARSVFLAAFVLLVGGAVLASSIAVGMGARTLLEKRLGTAGRAEELDEKSLWSHL